MSTHENERVALLALTKLPMSTSQAGPSKIKCHPPHQPRTLPAQLPPATGLDAAQRAQVTQAVRSSPVNDDLLRAFLWRYYQSSPAYKRGQAVSFREVKSDGSWKDASSRQLPLVRIDGIHSGQSEGVLHGKTMAFWRYKISYNQGDQLVQTMAWDIELGHPRELDVSLGPGVLSEAISEVFNLEVLKSRNPILEVLARTAMLQPVTSSMPDDRSASQTVEAKSSFLASKKPVIATQRYLLSDKLYMPPRAIQPNMPKGFVFPTEPRVFRSPTELRPSKAGDVLRGEPTRRQSNATSARPQLLMPEIRSASLPPSSGHLSDKLPARPSHKRAFSEISPPDTTKVSSKTRRLSLTMLCTAASDTYSPFEFE